MVLISFNNYSYLFSLAGRHRTLYLRNHISLLILTRDYRYCAKARAKARAKSNSQRIHLQYLHHNVAGLETYSLRHHNLLGMPHLPLYNLPSRLI